MPRKKKKLVVFVHTAKAGGVVLLRDGGARATAEQWDDPLVGDGSPKR